MAGNQDHSHCEWSLATLANPVVNDGECARMLVQGLRRCALRGAASQMKVADNRAVAMVRINAGW